MRPALLVAVLLQVLPQSPRDQQQSAAQRLVPSAIELRPAQVIAQLAGTVPKTVRLRIRPSRDFRAQTLSWQPRLRRLLDRVNQHTQRWPGVNFEIAEIKNWDKDSANVTMQTLLEDLERDDTGEDVDFVVGLGTAIPVMPESIHNLGEARVLGKHFVIRSLHDLTEYGVIRAKLDLLPALQRDALLASRREHKEQVVFLHEWAHALGAIHASHWDLIMNPSYDAGQSHFDDSNAKIIDIA